VNSIIVRAAVRVLRPLLLLYSLSLLLGGHDRPGGGFAGGLLAAAALALHVITGEIETARRFRIPEPRTIVGVGLLLALASALAPLLDGRPPLTGLWLTLPPSVGALPVGTPLVFDAGIYLVVIGVTLLMVATLAEEH
jgi:multicomponent Na+:H+ antiporter subunit B